MGGTENWLEGNPGRIEYDDPYGYEQRGPHTGKGPKGYERSTDRMREEVCERLTQHGEIDASEIEVNVEGGEITLSGTVDSRRSKRMAEAVAESVASVKDVHNRLTVRKGEAASREGGPNIAGPPMGSPRPRTSGTT
jgi:hypothetical protein